MIKTIKKLICVVPYIILAVLPLIGQNNLVPNPGFEEHTAGCPNGLGILAALDHWFSPTDGTPDAFNLCANPGNTGVPNNIFGSQLPKEGEGYAGIFCYGDNNLREYLGIKLETPLTPGQTYCINFYVSLADAQFYGIANLGMHFSTQQININNLSSVLSLSPQIEHNNEVIVNQTDWVPVTGTILADAPYEYLYIGNFRDNDTSIGGGTIIGTPINLDAYYYIDDVSVIQIDSELIITANTEICNGEEVIISASGGGDDYTWYELSQPQIPLSANTLLVTTITGPVSYFVITHIGNCILTDTIHFNPAPIPNLSIEAVEACAGYPVQFINNSQHVWPGALTIWETDGITDTIGGAFTHIYTEPGNYILTLTVLNNSACGNVLSIPVSVAGDCDICTQISSFSANGDFESYSYCASTLGASDSLECWQNPTTSTPDFFNRCNANDPEALNGVPHNIFGSQEPYNGNGYGGFYALQINNYREYFQNKLASPLMPGITYLVSFQVSLADTSGKAISDIGIYFSADLTDLTSPVFLGVLPYIPQIENTTIIDDTLNWVTISGTFTPTEQINYAIIGNFNENDESDAITLSSGDPNFAYYYLDALSISELPALTITINGEEIISSTQETCVGQIATLQASGSFCQFSWLSAENDILSTQAELLLTNAIPGSYNYIAAATAGNITLYDTIQIIIYTIPSPSFQVIEGCTTYPTLLINNSTHVSPQSVYEWDLDEDGITDTITNGSLSYLFEEAGNYSTSVHIINPGGCDSSTLINFTVEEVCDPCVLQNMVINPGFEIISGCPLLSGEITLADAWYSPGNDSADLYSMCSGDNIQTGLPDNVYGSQGVHIDGTNYSGILAYAPNDTRTYVTTPLLFPLEPGTEYCASMYVNLADESGVAIDFLGMYFSDENGIETPFSVTPQILNEETDIILDPQWVQISGTFVADTAHTHLTIGNFFNNTQTNAFLQANGSLSNISYYYLDDIAVVPVSAEISAPDTICLGESLTLSVASNMCQHEWTADNNPSILSTETEFTITPSTTTTYTYRGINELCDIIRTHTVVVLLIPDAGENITLCPGEIGVLNLQNAADATAIQWTPPTGLSNPNAANPTVNPLVTTTYQVTVTYPWNSNCPITDEITVIRLPDFGDAGPDQTLCDENPVQLMASGGTSYSWSPTTNLTNPTIANPIANPTATTTYTVTIFNDNGCAVTDEVTITILDCDNGGPVFINTNGTPFDSYLYDTTFQNTIDTTLIPHVFDPDPLDNISFNTSAPLHGLFDLHTDTAYFYPAVNFIGNDTVDLIACDNLFPIQCDTLHIVYTVLPALNSPPYFIPEGPIFDTIYTGDTLCIPIQILEFQQSDTISLFTVDNTPDFGYASLNADTSCLNYIAADFFLGMDSIFISACDQTDTCSILQIYFTILQNDIIANTDHFTTEDELPLTGFLLSNDTIPYSGIDELSVLEDPNHGEILLSDDFSFTYTPIAGFIGTDSFTYQICNDEWGCDTALVIIVVQNFLDALADIQDVMTDTSTAIPIFANDLFPDTACMTFSLVTLANHGELLYENGVLTYIPQPGYSGPDQFSYEICCTGYGCDIAIVVINVENLTPPEAVNDEYSFDMLSDMVLQITENDSDPNGLSFIITSIGGNPLGTVTYNSDQIFYQSPANYFGNDSLTYTLCNSAGLCDEATVYLTLLPICDLFIPEGFTPNGDGVNDNFHIQGLTTCDLFTTNKLIVYNRYGNVVHSAENYGTQEWWDGSWQKSKEPLPAGTYYYILKTEDNTRPNHLRGAVEIWR